MMLGPCVWWWMLVSWRSVLHQIRGQGEGLLLHRWVDLRLEICWKIWYDADISDLLNFKTEKKRIEEEINLI